MKNRYDDILRDHNQQILACYPSAKIFWEKAALEIQKWSFRNMNFATVLEIGAGEGDSTMPVLKKIQARIRTIDIVDVSPEMLRTCESRLEPHDHYDCMRFRCSDALQYLTKYWMNTYNVIYCAQTLHNFTREYREKLFPKIHEQLKQGGTFVLFDKVYPDKGGKKLLARQQKRYGRLPPEVCKAIREHEIQDFSLMYRMTESGTLKQLRKAGFSSVKILDRIERDILLVAKK